MKGIPFSTGSQIRRNEQMVRLDFSVETHRKYFLAQLGGEAHLRQEFPEMYSQYLKAIERDTMGGQAKHTDEPDAFSDGVDILYGCYDAERGRVICKGVTSLRQESSLILHNILVYSMTGELITSGGAASRYCRHASLTLNEAVQLTDAQKNSGLIFDYYAIWYDSSTGLNSGCYSSTDQMLWNAADYVQEVRMIDPVHRKTAEDGPIIVCYNRSSQSGETVDYDEYEEAFDPVTQKQRLYLDVGARVILSQEALPFSAVDMTRLMLKLDCQSGLAYYKKEGRVQEIMDSFRATEDGFEFRLDKDWQGVVPAARLPLQEPVDFLMRGEFLCDNYQKRGRFIIDSSSGTEPGSALIKTISQIRLLWGCVADDMPVLMADSSVRPAKDVRIGDRVRTEHGAGTVRDVIYGREQAPLYCIETENGGRLQCTGEHPVLTGCGYVQARELSGIDEIRDAANALVKITGIYPCEHASVVNFSISEDEESVGSMGGSFVCGGLVVGDNEMQRQLSCRREQENAEKIVTPEMERLKRYFEEGSR